MAGKGFRTSSQRVTKHWGEKQCLLRSVGQGPGIAPRHAASLLEQPENARSGSQLTCSRPEQISRQRKASA